MKKINNNLTSVSKTITYLLFLHTYILIFQLDISQAALFNPLQSICQSHTPFNASLICSSLLSLHARAGISDSDCGTQIAVALPCHSCCCCCCCWISTAFWPSLAFGQNFVCCTRRGPTKMLTSSCPAFLVNSFLVLALALASPPASGRLIAKVVDRLLSVARTGGWPSIHRYFA